jgi:small subunit ribosomal protein SAe
MMLACHVHLGAKNLDQHMVKYVHKTRSDGVNIINVAKTWEKLMLAARVIVAVENAQDVAVISSVEYGHRAVIKFAHFTGAKQFSGRFMPGTFTNQIQKVYCEPRLIIVSDPTADHQAVTEASYANIPVIAFCDTDSPLKYVDIAIPANLKSKQSMAIMFWLLTREVLRLRGSIGRRAWDIKPDLFLHKEEDDEGQQKQKDHRGGGDNDQAQSSDKVQSTREGGIGSGGGGGGDQHTAVAREEDVKLFGASEETSFLDK